MNIDKARLEQAIAEAAGVQAAIDLDGDRIVLSGIAGTAGEKDAALEIAAALAPGCEIVDDLTVESVLPEHIDELVLSEGDLEGFEGAASGTADRESLEPGDFTDQEVLRDPLGAAGPTGMRGGVPETEVGEGEDVYVPPTDPVRSREGDFIGGFQTTAMDDDEAVRSEVVGGPPDEALVEAVTTELRQDAATAGLEIRVLCRQGVVRLRGTVDDLEDAENAEAVAARVPGVAEVLDELEVRSA